MSVSVSIRHYMCVCLYVVSVSVCQCQFDCVCLGLWLCLCICVRQNLYGFHQTLTRDASKFTLCIVLNGRLDDMNFLVDSLPLVASISTQ